MDETITGFCPAVSVIISCWTEDRLRDISEAVVSVAIQLRPGDEVLVVVDNNERLYEELKGTMPESLSIMLHRGPRGLSATRNAAILQAKGELVAFLDDDAVASPNWLEELREVFADPRVVAAGGFTELRWPDRRPSWMPVEIEWVLGGGFSWLAREPRDVRNPHGNNMCLRANVFRLTGLFNPEAGRVGNGAEAGEEAEFFLRVRRALPSGRVLYQPRAAVVHKVSRNRMKLNYVLRRSFWEGVAKERIFHKEDSQSSRPLEPEVEYLRKILRSAIPSRLLRFYSPKEVLQAFVLILSTAATGLGYLYSRLGFESRMSAK